MAWEITPWRPFRELERIRKEMDELWESFFERKPVRRTGISEWMPSIDFSETKNNYVVKAELPGIDPKNIDISLTENVLTVKGEKKQEKEEETENYHFVERSYGSFVRSIELPGEVQTDKIKATYKDGVLKIILPKAEEAKRKEIKIKIE
ncbi:MAG: Hsp20/alpha crystallin family protein [Desulfobacterota bacterium]|nr:Hsp20/alpha crystallin family protein [Thermodesulfobacteriota bacterium]MDW8001563.1 Hsp20/alpha crystallin family protein [Deltaproteobacteria bacterium]